MAGTSRTTAGCFPGSLRHMRSETTTTSAKPTSRMFPAGVIGQTPSNAFMEFMETWKIAGARMLPSVPALRLFGSAGRHLGLTAGTANRTIVLVN